MKTKSKATTPQVREPTEEEIRDYAFHLYQQSGCLPGHDLENWLEAKACLEANIPRELSHTRVRHHRQEAAVAPEATGFVAVATAVRAVTDDDMGDGGAVVEEVLVIQPGR